MQFTVTNWYQGDIHFHLETKNQRKKIFSQVEQPVLAKVSQVASKIAKTF